MMNSLVAAGKICDPQDENPTEDAVIESVIRAIDHLSGDGAKLSMVMCDCGEAGTVQFYLRRHWRQVSAVH